MHRLLGDRYVGGAGCLEAFEYLRHPRSADRGEHADLLVVQDQGDGAVGALDAQTQDAGADRGGRPEGQQGKTGNASVVGLHEQADYPADATMRFRLLSIVAVASRNAPIA